ncbi:hypothetical protein BC833DRAFT_623827 [Globomyces pollinis-pini]|nr:hypothetical protein BC833DRAFT_623827 [Globomyces pollinis-pini]
MWTDYATIFSFILSILTLYSLDYKSMVLGKILPWCIFLAVIFSVLYLFITDVIVKYCKLNIPPSLAVLAYLFDMMSGFPLTLAHILRINALHSLHYMKRYTKLCMLVPTIYSAVDIYIVLMELEVISLNEELMVLALLFGELLFAITYSIMDVIITTRLVRLNDGRYKMEYFIPAIGGVACILVMIWTILNPRIGTSPIFLIWNLEIYLFQVVTNSISKTIKSFAQKVQSAQIEKSEALPSIPQ